MKEIKDYKMIILGIDQGNGNQKTTHRIIQSGVEPLIGEAIASKNVLCFKGKNYVVGESHLTYRGEKTDNDDFYLLNLAAIAEELDYRGYTEANIALAVGLPLAWVKAKQKAYREYLSKEDDLEYTYKGKLSNRRLSQAIFADYFRRKHLSHSAVNDADAHYTGGKRRLSRAYFSVAEAGLK